MRLGGIPINRSQGLVLAFFAMAWAGAVSVLVMAPAVYGRTLGRAPGGHVVGEAAFVVLLSALIGLIFFGVVRRWRWIFWLILAVFFLGILRVPLAVLQLSGHMAAGDPVWYIALQGVVGLLQFGIALAMLAGYRRSGVWGSF